MKAYKAVELFQTMVIVSLNMGNLTLEVNTLKNILVTREKEKAMLQEELDKERKFQKGYCHNPTLKECEDETYTPEIGTWEFSWTPETSQFDAGVKTPCIRVFFISLESYQSVDVENGSHGPFEHLQHKL